MKTDGRVHTLAFTSRERKRIAKAAEVCGWKPNESAEFGGELLLRTVAAILKNQRPGWGQ